MNIIHYSLSNYQTGSTGGSPRFNHELQKAIPQLINVCKLKDGAFFNTKWAKEDCVVITENGLCLDVPANIKCIAVHHGMARTHQERSPEWSGQCYVKPQDAMISRKNTFFVGCSTFTKNEFYKHYKKYDYDCILHSVDTKPITKVTPGKNVIVDCRNKDKGSEAIKELRKESRFNFIDLKCGKFNKAEGYRDGNIYLSLSLSEGNSYSMLDAIACNLPILATNVGLFGGDYHKDLGEVISWKERGNLKLVNEKLNHIRENFESYAPAKWLKNNNNFNEWKARWVDLVRRVADE